MDLNKETLWQVDALYEQTTTDKRRGTFVDTCIVPRFAVMANNCETAFYRAREVVFAAKGGCDRMTGWVFNATVKQITSDVKMHLTSNVDAPCAMINYDYTTHNANR